MALSYDERACSRRAGGSSSRCSPSRRASPPRCRRSASFFPCSRTRSAPAARVREHGKKDAERRHRGGDARRDGEQRDDDPPARREHARSSYDSAMAKPYVLEFGMGVDLHGADATTAAKRAVSDAIRHSSLPFFADVRARGGRMLVDVTVGVPDPKAVDVAAVKRELPHGEGAVRAVEGGLRVPVGDTIIACVAITVSID